MNFFAYFGVCCDFGGRAEPQNFAILDDVSAVTDRQRLSHVVVRNDDANFAISKLLDDFLNVDHGDRIDSREGLVQ